MFERKLSALEMRKRLLVTESEVNRALLVSECEHVAAQVREFAQPFHCLRGVFSTATTLFDVFKAHKAQSNGASHSKLGRFLQLALSLWMGLKTKRETDLHEEAAE